MGASAILRVFRLSVYASGTIERMRSIVSTRLSDELIDVLDAWAVALKTTRSTVLRGLIEDGIDAGELPSVPPTSQQLLDAEDERLRELTRR